MLLHSHMRNAVFLFAVLSIIVSLIAVIRKQEIPSVGKWIIRLYSVVITLQFLIGIANLLWRWNVGSDMLRYRVEHAVIMLVALGVVHTAPRYMKRYGGAQQTMFLMIGSLLLIVLGIWILPQGPIILGFQ